MLTPSQQLFFNSSTSSARRWTLEQLLAIKGSMWTTRLSIPFGPRPNQPSNILAMDYYEYYNKSDRMRMLDTYRNKMHFTHAVTGPLVDTGGYHGLYPSTPNRPPSLQEFNAYLDFIEEWHEADLIPIHFVHPDGWSLDDMNSLVSLYSTKRAKELLPIKVWTGWEPTRYDWTNNYWCQFLQQARRVDSDGVLLVHTVCDTDALTGGDDDKTFPPGQGNRISWENACKYLDGWLVQNCGYFEPINDRNDPRWKTQYDNFRVNLPNQFNNFSNGSLAQRFHSGYAGWPTYSYRGNDKHLKIYAAEFAAYPNFWWNWPYQEAFSLGDSALAAGADGVLDGLNV